MKRLKVSAAEVRRYGSHRYGAGNSGPEDRVASAMMTLLYRQRLAAGVPQHEVARRMGTSQGAVSDLETKKVRPSVSMLLRYAGAVGVTSLVFDAGSGETEDAAG